MYKHLFFFTLLVIMIVSSDIRVNGQKRIAADEIAKPIAYKPPKIEMSDDIQSDLDTSVAASIAAMPSFKMSQISATLIDITDPNVWKAASIRGDAKIYPASVVKLFYLAAIERQIEDKKIVETAELRRGIHDMIVDSSNEATQYILDVITHTSSGGELPQKQFIEWQYKRNAVNRFYTSLGYTSINVNQKTFCEDAYGIEQQSRNYQGQNRNMLTSDATAKAMGEIVTGRIVNKERTDEMMSLLHRDPFAKGSDDDQAHGFIGRALINEKSEGVKIWSKAGWTSKARHDAAYLELPNGKKLVMVIFTEDHAADTGFIPMVAKLVIKEFTK